MLLFTAQTSVIILAASLGILGFGLGGNAAIFMKVVLSGVPAETAGAGTGTYGLFRDLAAPFGVAIFVPLFTNRVTNIISSGKGKITAAVNSIKFLAVAEIICVIVGIAIVLFLPKIYNKKGEKARNLELAKQEADKLNSEGCIVRYVYNDASKPESYISMTDEVIKDAGRIDVLVNNFGTSNPGKDLDFSNTDTDVFFDIVNINLRSVFMASKEAAKHMAKNGGGSIINISSVGGLVPDISQVAYGTSKAAINYLTKLIAVHEAKNNIRCNAILPGMTATDAVEKNLTEGFRELFMRHIPFKRMGAPEEIAAAAVYFASDDSAYTTGQILTVSGGFGLATPVYGDLSDKLNRR